MVSRFFEDPGFLPRRLERLFLADELLLVGVCASG
jgi:hypothetical protein